MSLKRLATRTALALGLGLGALTTTAPTASAQNYFIGTISAFGFNFCPRGWALADGTLLPISTNNALFSLYGTTYGGNGRTTFGLPDLRGRIPIHQGTGPGLSTYLLGSRGGVETVTLTPAQMPSHTHSVLASADTGTSPTPVNQFAAQPLESNGNSVVMYSNDTSALVSMNSSVIAGAGGSQAHENRPPTLAIRWCVSIVGTYPSRS